MIFNKKDGFRVYFIRKRTKTKILDFKVPGYFR